MKFLKQLKRKVDAFLDKPSIQTWWSKLNNKYVITGLIFVVWVSFIDDNNLVRRFLLWREYQTLQETKQFYLDKIDQDRKSMRALDKNKNLEQLAREKYLMKKSNEDIFMIQEED